MQNKRLYGVYNGMKQRCFNPKCAIWEHYGGRGITVCGEWLRRRGRVAFMAWAEANGYREGLCIDRVDNDGDYSPGNCRWVTRAENLRNRRMTPKWAAFLAKQMARIHSGEYGKRRMTEKRLEALRRNMAKARETRWANRPVPEFTYMI